MSTTKKAGRFKNGDWVAFRYGVMDLVARVIDERGPLGVGGRYLYGMHLPLAGGKDDYLELPEDELQPAPQPDKSRLIEYLKRGGLVEVLRRNLSGGRSPRVWFEERQGNVEPTFQRGGVPVPFFALQGDRIFEPKESEVVSFLESLGLTEREAREIIAHVQ